MDERDKRKEEWAQAIFEAQRDHRQIPGPSRHFGELSLEEAYAVQLRVADLWEEHGERQIGWKVGATSFAILEQLKGQIDGPMYGCLRSGAVYGERGEVRSSDFFSIGLEPEIGVVLDAPLRGPGITPVDAARAAGSVVALTEILDTRLLPDERGLQDGAADNGSHGGIILGGVVCPAAGFDFVHEGVVVRVNGRLWGSACGVEALGNPLNVVAWLANELAVQGRELRAGDLVSTGSVTRILTPEVGDVVEMSFANLGVISFAIT